LGIIYTSHHDRESQSVAIKKNRQAIEKATDKGEKIHSKVNVPKTCLVSSILSIHHNNGMLLSESACHIGSNWPLIGR